jgi:hypothetical protein
VTRKSGLADSPLFHTAPPSPSEEKDDPQAKYDKENKQKREEKDALEIQGDQATPHRDATTPRHHDTMPPTTVSRYHDTVVEVVRRAVKEFGKEAATHRFTLEEKQAIAEVLYTYQRQGIRTSENEITRIAVNFILDDYREHGENSLLDRVLKALNE